MGPLCTQLLGDFGADVITVEPAEGDINRTMGPGPVRGLSDVSLNLLRNKRNVTIDLKRNEGRAAFLDIAATCDVLVTNLRPGPLARLRLSYGDVVAVRPDIVYCQAQGFPTDGSRADEPAFDDVIQAAGGVPDVMRRAGLEPTLLPTLLADKVSGILLTNAVLAALYHRARTGEGQRVEVAMVDAVAAFLLVEHSSGAAVDRPDGGGAGYRRILTQHRRPQETSDGWITVFPYLQSHWAAILRAGGAEDLVDDPRLTRRGRQADSGFAYGALARAIVTRPTAEWMELCRSEGIPASEVGDLDEQMRSYPLAEHPLAGPYHAIPSPVRFGRTPASVRRPAPLIGQHTEEVLAEIGYRPERIAALRSSGVLDHPRVTRAAAGPDGPGPDA
jgi:crotonobetainyl-CoA:carnitine CoA-transferase CaiB-like acyl-CoA transferase